MKKIGNIKAFVGYNEVNNFHYYQNFEIVDELPKIRDEIDDSKVVAINPVNLDCEQPNDSVYSYDYYKLTLKYEDYDDTYAMYVCVEKETEE